MVGCRHARRRSLFVTVRPSDPAGTTSVGRGRAIDAASLKEWLTFIASDELQGRQVYTEGLGLAAAYIADHLKEWGVKPAGENGSYFQTVKVVGVKTTSRASVTVDVNGQTRTFKDGEGVTFPRNMGGTQTLTGDQILFAGYGLQLPTAKIDDYANVNPKGKVVVWLGPGGPKAAASESRRLLSGIARTRQAIEKGAVGVVSPPSVGLFGGGARGIRRPAAGATRRRRRSTSTSPRFSATTRRSHRLSRRPMSSSSFCSVPRTSNTPS